MSNENLSSPTSNLEEITALKELVAVIVDYYCFKNNDLQDDDDDESDSWKKNMNQNENKDVIPEKINSMIEKSFHTQLKKFID